MPNVTTEPDVLQQEKLERLNKILEYAPLVKSIAAVGVGAFGGESGKTRGITRGLVNSAENDIKARQLADIARREQTEKDIKARQEQTKLRFDTIYKIWNGIENPKAKDLYAQNMNLVSLGEEYLGTHFELPATPASPAPMQINTKDVRSIIDEVKDPATKARLEVYYGLMVQAISQNDGTEARIDYDRIVDISTPTPKTYYKEDGSGAEDFPDAKTAFDAGYPRSTYPGVDTNDPAKDGKEDLKKQVSEINQATEALEIKSFVKYDNETVNYVKAFENIGSKISGALLLAGGLDVNVPTISSPFPGTIDGPYHLLAASNFIKGVVTNALDNPGLSERLGTMPGIEQVIKDNISTINQMAENMRAEDESRDAVQINSKKTEVQTGPKNYTKLVTDAFSSGTLTPQSSDNEIIQVLMDNGMARKEAEQWVKDNQ